jgi:RNA polymerase sigma factor (sigma-70 family)
MNAQSVDLVARWRAGDEEAATELYTRHARRLAALAGKRMSEKLSRRLDPEDVVLSAYRSLFAGIDAERFTVQRSGDLWALLVAITLNKLRRQVERHTAARRALAREATTDTAAEAGCEVAGREPSPVEAAALADEVEALVSDLDPLQRRMVELRLEGYALEDIAAVTERSERTVRRVLDQVKARLEARHAESLAG